jgi:hypothetical protein
MNWDQSWLGREKSNTRCGLRSYKAKMLTFSGFTQDTNKNKNKTIFANKILS